MSAHISSASILSAAMSGPASAPQAHHARAQRRPSAQILARRPVSALALVLAAAPALAAESEETVLLPTIYYSVSAAPVAPGATGVSVTQLDRAAIDAAASRTLPNYLASTPGVSLSQEGGLGSTATLRIRGLGNGYIATRLDGIDIADPSNPQVYFNYGLASPLGLDRIELLRGSQSALHGSEAIAGVVDMATFRPSRDGFSGESRIEAGSHGSYSAATDFGYRGAQGEASLSLAHLTTDGISAKSDNDERDAAEMTFLSYHLAHDVSPALRLGLNGHLRENHAEYDETGAPEGNFNDSTTRAVRLYAEADLGATQHQLAFSNLDISRTAQSALYGAYPTDGARDELSYNGHWERSEGLSLHWGYERSRESFAGASARGTATTDAVFGEVLWAATPDLDLSLAARVIDHDSFGQHSTGRLAAAYRPHADWILRGALATGLTLPSPYQRFSEAGHADLAPEDSRSLELGAEYLWGDSGSLQLTYFDITVENRIDYVEGAGPCASSWGCFKQIAGETRSQGIELAGRMALGAQWQLTGNYTYTDAATHSAGTTTAQARVPRHALNLGLEGEVNDTTSLTLGLRHVADHFDALYGGAQVPLADYTLVDVAARYAVSETAAVYLQVENLFDTDYETASGYNQPGRQIHLGLTTAF